LRHAAHFALMIVVVISTVFYAPIGPFLFRVCSISMPFGVSHGKSTDTPWSWLLLYVEFDTTSRPFWGKTVFFFLGIAKSLNRHITSLAHEG